MVNTYERAGVIPGVEKVEETVFEEDPLLLMYRNQIAEAVHILSNIHPAWLDSPEELCQEEDFVEVDRQWNRILKECDNE
mgnify:CR=1 FL=1